MARIEDFPGFTECCNNEWVLNGEQLDSLVNWLQTHNIDIKPHINDALRILSNYEPYDMSKFIESLKFEKIETLSLLTLIRSNASDAVYIQLKKVLKAPVYGYILGILVNNGWRIYYGLGNNDSDTITNHIIGNYAKEMRLAELEAENERLHAEIAELRLRPPGVGGPDYEAAKLRFNTAASQ